MRIGLRRLSERVTQRNSHGLGAGSAKLKGMSLDDYKVVLYRNKPSGW